MLERQLNRYTARNTFDYFIGKFLRRELDFYIKNDVIFLDDIDEQDEAKTKGVGFFDDAGFYPDFILWFIADEKQYITFIDPHGMGRESISSSKVKLYNRLKNDIEPSLTVPSVALTSFILSQTKCSELADKSTTIEEWKANHVLFMGDSDYIEKLFEGISN